MSAEVKAAIEVRSLTKRFGRVAAVEDDGKLLVLEFDKAA